MHALRLSLALSLCVLFTLTPGRSTAAAGTCVINGTTYTASDSWHPTRSGYANGLAPELRAVIG